MLAALLAGVAPEARAQVKPSPTNPVTRDADTIRLSNGMRYWTTQPGSGERPSPGQKVWVHYTGRLVDGRIFDTSSISGKPLKFTVGAGQVIPGMDQVVALMHVGQKITVLIPAALGYGPAGQADDPDDINTAYRIPPNSDLTFDLELVRCTK